MVKMVVAQRYDFSFLSGTCDLLPASNNGLEFFRVGWQAKTVRAKRNSCIKKNFRVWSFNVRAHGSYAEAFGSQRNNLDVS